MILTYEQCQQILTFLTLLGDLQFFWIKVAGLCKNGGWLPGVDVMLDNMGWCRLHIPGAKNRGEFLQQSFYISRHGIRYCLIRGGRV